MPPSLVNFRDLGGLRGHGGRSLRHGRLFRSAQLSCLAAADHEAFAALGIRTIIDLRRPREIAEFGRLALLDGFVVREVYLRHRMWQPQILGLGQELAETQELTEAQELAETQELTEAQELAEAPELAEARARARYLADRYRDMAKEAAEDIGEALRVIADPANYPVVVHCVAGKDRTGVVIGLTLALLGVDDDTIADDFAASEPEQPRLTEWFRVNVPRSFDPRPEYLLAPRETMLVFLDELREQHGSVESYVSSVGVTDSHIASMRDHLLDQ